MQLIRPAKEYIKSYTEAIEEDVLHRPESERSFSDPATIIDKAYKFEQGIDLKPGYVKSTTFWLVDKGIFIGEIRIRHELTPQLLKFGGHIGYEVRWSEINKGYATKMLSMALPYCRDILKLSRVLITCDDNNIASAKVIEKNGGVLENKVINHLERGSVTTRRYWIEL
jgi:predicted acetyltransferase